MEYPFTWSHFQSADALSTQRSSKGTRITSYSTGRLASSTGDITGQIIFPLPNKQSQSTAGNFKLRPQPENNT